MFNKARMAISKSIELYNQILRAYKFHPYANIVAGAVDTRAPRYTCVRSVQKKKKKITPNTMKTLRNWTALSISNGSVEVIVRSILQSVSQKMHRGVLMKRLQNNSSRVRVCA